MQPSLIIPMAFSALGYNTNADRPLSGVVSVEAEDVICGRGGFANNHVGNVSWRMLVAENKPRYKNLNRFGKTMMAATIVQTIRNHNGRFLKKDPETNLWNDIGDSLARKKTSQALREGVRQSEETPAPSSEKVCNTSRTKEISQEDNVNDDESMKSIDTTDKSREGISEKLEYINATSVIDALLSEDNDFEAMKQTSSHAHEPSCNSGSIKSSNLLLPIDEDLASLPSLLSMTSLGPRSVRSTGVGSIQSSAMGSIQSSGVSLRSFQGRSLEANSVMDVDSVVSEDVSCGSLKLTVRETGALILNS